jgi:hypothetical protein
MVWYGKVVWIDCVWRECFWEANDDRSDLNMSSQGNLDNCY